MPMKTIDFSYFIERYNACEMDEAEKLWFQKELDGNEKLRKEVELRKKTDAILKKQDVIGLRSKLTAIEKSRETEVYAKKRLMPGYFKYAAVLALLIAIGGLVIFNNKQPDSDILEKYYKP